MFGEEYTGEEKEIATSNINWITIFIKSLLDATKKREKVIWRREGNGEEYSTSLTVDSKIHVLKFGSVHNRARKPPVIHYLKIIFNLGDISILEPDQASGFIKTRYKSESEANLALLMQELGLEIEKQVKINEAKIEKDIGIILQQISSTLQ